MLYILLILTILFIISKIAVWFFQRDKIYESNEEIPSDVSKDILIDFVYQVNNGGFNQLFRNFIGRDNDDLSQLENSIQNLGNQNLIDLFEKTKQVFAENQDQLMNLRFNSEDPIKGFSESYNLDLFSKLDEEFYKLDQEDAIFKEVENRINTNEIETGKL